jgi:hypothetical protein
VSFDPALAEFRVATLPLERVIDPLALTHAPDRVAHYRDCMAAGERFPPIAVVRVLGLYLVADGHKRLAAYRSLGFTDILVEVWPLGRWARDQRRQAVANLRKNRTIARLAMREPQTAFRLLLSTILHWKRVGASLAFLITGRRR